MCLAAYLDCSISFVVTRFIESRWLRRGRFRGKDRMTAVTASEVRQSAYAPGN